MQNDGSCNANDVIGWKGAMAGQECIYAGTLKRQLGKWVKHNRLMVKKDKSIHEYGWQKIHLRYCLEWELSWSLCRVMNRNTVFNRCHDRFSNNVIKNLHMNQSDEWNFAPVYVSLCARTWSRLYTSINNQKTSGLLPMHNIGSLSSRRCHQMAFCKATTIKRITFSSHIEH